MITFSDPMIHVFSYFLNSFTFLQMYIASTAATASMASENIVNTIILSFL